MRRNLRRKNDKKGNMVADSFTIIVILVVFGTLALIGWTIFSEFNSAFQEDDDIPVEVKAQTQSMTFQYRDIMDDLAVLVLIVAWAAALLFSFLVDSHPVFFVLSLIFVFTIFLLAATMGNAYVDVADDESMIEYSQDLPKLRWIMEHLVEISILIAFSIGIVLYGKVSS